MGDLDSQLRCLLMVGAADVDEVILGRPGAERVVSQLEPVRDRCRVADSRVELALLLC
jgi:hypothetical protein